MKAKTSEKSDPFQPSAQLLIKLGSIIVHADELTGPRGHPLDATAMRPLIEDAEVKDWIKGMGVYLPLKR